jgi:hypothetical protein
MVQQMKPMEVQEAYEAGYEACRQAVQEARDFMY